MMPPGDTLARRWRRLKKRCSFSTGDNNKLVRSKSFTEQAGLEKTRVLFKINPAQCFFVVFFGFFGFFLVFLIYLPRR
jgi:hypothetical protein